MKMHDFFQSHRDEICEMYLKPISEAGSKKDLADLLDINACEWLCQMNARHGGIGEWVAANFGNFINGRFVNERNGYTTELYSGVSYTHSQLPLRSTVTAFIDCDVEIVVRRNEVRRIVCSKSRIKAVLEENAELLVAKDGDSEISIECGEKSKYNIKDLKQDGLG